MASPAARTSIEGLLDGAASEADRWGRPDLAQTLARERDRVRETACYVAVVGEFRKGKSTLINALLNASVCGVDVLGSTVVPTVLRYGSEPSARFTVRSEDPPVETTESLVGIADVSLRSMTRPAAGPGVPRLDVELPRRLLKEGVVLVDTPPVGGGLAGAHSAFALRSLSTADAVLFVTDASQELTAPEVAFLQRAAEICPDIVCALTKTDFYPEWRRILDLDRQHLQLAGVTADVLPLSAPVRLDSLRSAGGSGVDPSGYGRLERHLVGNVVNRSRQTGNRRAVVQLRACLGQILSQAAAEQESLSTSGDAEVLARWSQAQQEAERLRTASARWQQVLADRCAELVSSAELDLTVRLRNVRRETAGRIEGSDPADSWSTLESWLYSRANEELLSHFATLRSSADDLAADVGALFGKQAADLAEQLDLAVASPFASTGNLSGVGNVKVSWSELGIQAARGTSLGLAVTHGAALLPGVTLLPLLPVTALVAVGFGRRMVRSAREAQVKVRRAEAVRAVNAFLDETEMLARKDSRDAVRRVQQRVRDYFAETATQLQRSATSTLQVVEQGVRTDTEARSRRLGEMRSELTRLRPLVAATDRLLSTGARTASVGQA